MNSRAFTPEEVADGHLNDLLKYLLNHNEKNDEHYYDIHITSDGFCQIVEWVDIPYNSNYECGRFEFVNDDEIVMKELILPDNSITYVHNDVEADEVMQDFLKENPEYKKNSYGRWVNTNEILELE